MANKVPPVPPENRSKAGPGSAPNVPTDTSKPNANLPNLEEQGRYGNINQNTHNEGYQQDR